MPLNKIDLYSEFLKVETFLLLQYSPERDGVDFVHKYLRNGSFTLKKTFVFHRNDIYASPTNESSIIFNIATLKDNYYVFNSGILDIDFTLYIHKDIKFDKHIFIAKGSYNISIFQAIDTVISSKELYIGGHQKNHIPLEEFQKFLKEFPTHTEMEKYKTSRIEIILREYFDTKRNFEDEYTKYMNKKISKTGFNLDSIIQVYETEKYHLILKKLKEMLDDEDSYTEANWQKEILQIIRLIYPKYVSVLEEVTIKNSYDNTTKRLDLVLVDSNGNIDIVEIKKPFGDKGVLSKGQYRNNFVPKRELSGSIMQVEKYIFYLNKFTKKQEQLMTNEYQEHLPKGLKIQVINPKGFIIVGRDSVFDTQQKKDDFEIIKRKYKNLMDIITYDDLVRRVENVLNSFKLHPRD